jgi:hypothetical protein
VAVRGNVYDARMSDSPIEVLIVPAGTEEPHVAVIEPGLAQLQELVGGMVQAIPLAGNALVLINEEGKYHGLPHNEAATEFVKKLGIGMAPDDYIVGTMVVVGALNSRGVSDGEMHPCPVEIVNALTQLT